MTAIAVTHLQLRYQVLHWNVPDKCGTRRPVRNKLAMTSKIVPSTVTQTFTLLSDKITILDSWISFKMEKKLAYTRHLGVV